MSAPPLLLLCFARLLPSQHIIASSLWAFAVPDAKENVGKHARYDRTSGEPSDRECLPEGGAEEKRVLMPDRMSDSISDGMPDTDITT